MTKKEQHNFVSDLIGAVRLSIITKIEAGDLPVEWDGVELRQYIADKFAEQSFTWDKQPQSRRRSYRNQIATTDL